MKVHNNNKVKTTKSHTKDEIDLKTHSIQDLYAMAETEYKRVSGAEENKWHAIISRGGTKKDKISLMATEIFNSPHTSLQKFEELARWCYDNNHHFALDACRALVNIFHQFVFSDKNTLKIFVDSVQGEIKQGKKKAVVGLADLVGYYIEHHIKHFYGELIRSIQVLLTATVSFVKKTAIKLLTSLTRHGELRRMIINTLINKFGDSDMEIVNQTYKSLKDQFYQDLQSSFILLEEAQTFLFRQNVSRKSQFYVINFLNNLNMKFFNEKGLSKLFELFYHFFEKLMGQQNDHGSLSSRLFLNSIKGLNKIFTFIKGGNKQTKQLISSKIESVYTIVHKTTNFKAKIQLYLFLFQYHSHIHGSLTDRYYRSLYDFIRHEQVLNCSLAELFFDLILISIKQDQNISRILAFIKRMLQLCFSAQSNFIVTTLIMVGKIFEEKEALKIVIHQKQNCMAEEGQAKKYDLAKRQPIYAGAENTLIWELTTFSNHYHPTVRKFANHLIKGEDIPYDGTNPMLELSTTSFLQKLILKKQKKSQGWKVKMKKHLNKIRRSKYQTLVDKPHQNFKEDQEFIKKYLEQRTTIHTNFKKRQPTDIDEFADQVIQKQMKRLNPRDADVDLSLSQQPDENDFEEDLEGQFQGQQGDEIQGQGDQLEQDQFGEGSMEDEQFGSNPEEENFDEEGDEEDNDEDEEQQQQESDQKQFEEAFNEIGDNEDEYPRKRAPKGNFNNRKQNKKISKVGNRKSFKNKKLRK